MTNGLASCVPDILRGEALDDGDVEVQFLLVTWHVSWSRDSPPAPWPRVASSHLHPLAPTISRKSQQPALVLDLEKGNEVTLSFFCVRRRKFNILEQGEWVGKVVLCNQTFFYI